MISTAHFADMCCFIRRLEVPHACNIFTPFKFISTMPFVVSPLELEEI